MTSLLSVDDLTDDAVEQLMSRSVELLNGSPSHAAVRRAAMFFLEPSLRTRTGFLAAAQAVGWPTPVEVIERRSTAETVAESLGDTVAVLGGYFEVLVVRADRPISATTTHVPDGVAVVNAGDRGERAEHPTQALIDLFAMRQLVGPVHELTVALCGDLRMRSARSLLRLLSRLRPAELVLVTDPALTAGLSLPPGLECRVAESFEGLVGVDALHAVGIPHRAVTEDVRTRLRIDAAALGSLSERGRVFSPMPVIDEVAQTIRSDPRVSYLTQSALALPVREAVLEAL